MEFIKYNLQVISNAFRSDALTDTAKLQRGDVIGCIGHVGKSSKGDLVIVAQDIKLLAPSLHTLPHSLDDETRFKSRYLDLILNEKVC